MYLLTTYIHNGEGQFKALVANSKQREGEKTGFLTLAAQSNCTVSNLVFVYTDTVAHVKTICIKVS